MKESESAEASENEEAPVKSNKKKFFTIPNIFKESIIRTRLMLEIFFIYLIFEYEAQTLTGLDQYIPVWTQKYYFAKVLPAINPGRFFSFFCCF